MIVDEVAAPLEPWLPSDAARSLQKKLTAVPAGAPLHERTKALVTLAEWLTAESPTAEGVAARLTELLMLLRHAPALRERLVALTRSVLAETNAVPLFADTGLPHSNRFFTTAFDRIARRVLPEAPHERDLAELVGRMLPGQKAGDWFEEVPKELLAAFAEVIGDEGWLPVRAAMFDGLTVLAIRVSSLGLNPELRRRGAEGSVGDSPFVALVRSCERLVETRVRPVTEQTAEAIRGACLRDIEGCRAVTQRVRAHLEELGVSVDLVYHLELIEHHLTRIEELIPLLLPLPDASRGEAARRLIAHLARARAREQSLRALLSGSVQLLARKVIERAGATGEHYITTDRGEYQSMLRSASGGGALTTLTVIIKFLCLRMTVAPFFEGLFPSLNYAASFLGLQFLGFTLATKQPSMTAAALAGALPDNSRRESLTPLVDLIARITRSQLAAVVGNLTLVTVCTMAFHFAYLALFGAPFLSVHEAEHVAESLNPVRSGTLFFAALTGFLLWLSSLFAGWLENWAVFRSLPEGIARHRGLIGLVGEERARAISAFFARNVSGIGGNVSLGFMLGMLPTIGKFFGLPLEVRHITLSTGSLALAGLTTPHMVSAPTFWWALCGLAFIGVLNFAVSFSLALAVAVRARGVPRGTLGRLAEALVKRVRSGPREFLLPPAR